MGRSGLILERYNLPPPSGSLCAKGKYKDKLCFPGKLFYLHLGSCYRSFASQLSTPSPAELGSGISAQSTRVGSDSEPESQIPRFGIHSDIRLSHLISFRQSTAQLFHFRSSSREILHKFTLSLKNAPLRDYTSPTNLWAPPPFHQVPTSPSKYPP